MPDSLRLAAAVEQVKVQASLRIIERIFAEALFFVLNFSKFRPVG